jgi:hypothetical protein
MRDLLILLIHFITTVAGRASPGGIRSPVLVKHVAAVGPTSAISGG